jgi:hypothetical protein
MYKFEVRRDIVPLIIIVAIFSYVMLVPVSTFTEYEVLSNFLKTTCNYMPYPCRLAANTDVPEVTQSILLLSVVGAFIAAPVYLYFFMRKKRFDEFQSNSFLMYFGWVFIFLALFPFYSGGERATTSRFEMFLVIASHYRITLALFSIFFLIGEIALLMICAIWIKCVIIARRP